MAENKKTIINQVSDYLEGQLNDNTQDLAFDLGYLFKRDGSGLYHVIGDVNNKFATKKQSYITGMFGTFTSDPNKPLNFLSSGLIGKSGTTTLLFAIPDADDNDNYFKSLLALEEFENKMAGKTDLVGATFEEDGITIKEEGYNVEFNSFVLNRTGSAIKRFGEMQTLVGLTFSMVLAKGLPVGGMFRYEVARAAIPEVFTRLEVNDNKDAIASTPIATQGADKNEAGVGITDTLFNRTFFIYYATDIGKELVRRCHDPSKSSLSKDYIIRTTLYKDGRGEVVGLQDKNIDYTFDRPVKFVGGSPTMQKGNFYGAAINWSPREIKNPTS